MKIKTKRIYDPPEESDGYRILVDRLWPRGLKKDKAKIDRWVKDIAPSKELRTWYGHDPKKWQEFREWYFDQLDAKRDLVQEMVKEGKGKQITLLFSAKNEQLNNAVCLKEYIDSKLG